MQTLNVAMITATIEQAAGIVGGAIDGIPVEFLVQPISNNMPHGKTAVYDRHQIYVGIPGQVMRFRTNPYDGSFNVDGVVAALETQARARRLQMEVERRRQQSAVDAEELRGLLNGPASAYASGANYSYIAPSTTEGHVTIQLSFGSVPVERARQIIEVFNQIQQEQQ